MDVFVKGVLKPEFILTQVVCIYLSATGSGCVTQAGCKLHLAAASQVLWSWVYPHIQLSIAIYSQSPV